MPRWLFDHHVDLARVKFQQSGGQTRIAVLHPNLNARDECLRSLNVASDEPLPVDSSLHLTIDSLIDLLHADLRLPQPIEDDAILFELIHRRCSQVASAAGFPFLHTNLEADWGRGRTRMLDQLHRALSERRLPDPWEDDPGLQEYERVLVGVERDLGMTHPRMRLPRIIDRLGSSTHRDEIFSLRDIDGIVMLDHDPTLSHLRIELLLAVARLVPIHQLCNPGSFRLGEHGAFLLDIPACRSDDETPDWLPPHSPGIEASTEPGTIHYLGLQRSQHCDEAVYSLLTRMLAINPERARDILIIDPDADQRAENWHRLLAPAGLRTQKKSQLETASRGVHWLKQLSRIGQGPTAWSLSSLRALLSQSSLPLASTWLRSDSHPSHPDRTPLADIETLESVARAYHIQGGPGSLNQWLHALSQSRFDAVLRDEAQVRKSREQTQWWLLCLATRMAPLLHREDHRALRDSRFCNGCDSGEALPLPPRSAEGDEWLEQLARNIDWHNWMESITEGHAAVAGVQRILRSHALLRQKQRECSLPIISSGKEWVAEFAELSEDVKVSSSSSFDPSLRVLTPARALGCTAEIVIITHLGVDEWPLKVPALPWIDAEKTAKSGLLDPDSPLRSARHCFAHALFAGRTTLILDPIWDEETQPATPFAELRDWIAEASSAQPPDFLTGDAGWRMIEGGSKSIATFIPDEMCSIDGRTSLRVHGWTPRAIRQRDGLAINREEPISRPAINPAGSLICREESLHRDRIHREPSGIALSSDYRDWSTRSLQVSTTKLNLRPSALPKNAVPPRQAESWPVLGRQHNRNRSTPSIDPRPLAWDGIGIDALDSSTGHLDQPVGLADQVWSASRLKSWMQCPRMGWLERRLRAAAPDVLKRDLDERTRGITLHNSIGELICGKLGFEMGEERTEFSPANIATCGLSAEELMSELLRIVSTQSAWLNRSDSMAVQRRRDFCGMSLDEYDMWWDEDTPPLPPRARLGALILAELSLADSVPLVFEAGLGAMSGDPASPMVFTDPAGGDDSLQLRGWIDRVDMVPFPNGSWLNESGDLSPAPLSDFAGWKPRRLIVVRDMKTVDGPMQSHENRRHLQALFEDSQLALYSRAWELSHPGDLVIGAGITQIGARTSHRLEVDPDYTDHLLELEVGEITKHTHTHFRQPGESLPPSSNPFREWMRWRLLTAFRTARMAQKGAVHPTPGANCRFCNVKRICGLSHLGGDQW